MEIKRLRGNAAGRSRAAAYGDLVFTVATDEDESPSLAEQTRRSLAAIDENLAEMGSDKTRLVSATVYVTDIGCKDEMDAVWCEWIGAESGHWPQRACVQAALVEGTLVEITVVAATRRQP